MRLLKFLQILFICFVLCLVIAPNAKAADFSFDYDVFYTVDATGNTKVKQNITITNLVTDYFAQNFSLTIFSKNIHNVAANDTIGTIIPRVTENEGQTTIQVPFNAKVVGAGSKLGFTLSYDTEDLAIKKGRVWEIVIPGIEKSQEISSYKVHLEVPESFGTAAYMTPLPNASGVWTVQELKDGGITVAFGDYQRFSFNLIYHLENTSEQPRTQEITLPPDTSYQKVILSHLSELPQNVRIDRDGNWLAAYTLDSNQSKKIAAEGSVILYAFPQLGDTTLSSQDISFYTKALPFWEQSPEIIARAKDLKDPSASSGQAAKAIYDAVIGTLTYDFERVRPGIQRLGAAGALAEPSSAVCMEFSDLFVALSRSTGIPAREVHGYAYTTNDRLQPLSLVTDVLHAWTEYFDFDKKQWIQVDPTWGNTTRGVDYFSKLDFNHFAFAILGERSDYPYPAGSFKKDASTKDVYVDFDTSDSPIPEPRFKLELDVPDTISSGRKIKTSVAIRNNGQVLFDPQNMIIESDLKLDYEAQDVGNIPPYGYVEVPMTIFASPAFASQDYKLAVTLNGQTFTKTITASPVYIGYLPLVGIIFIAGGAIFAILHVHGKRKSSSHRS